MAAQPYTRDDLTRGEAIACALYGLSGTEAWAKRIAKELAEERRRERAACVAVAEATVHEHGDGEGEIYIARKIADAIKAGR